MPIQPTDSTVAVRAIGAATALGGAAQAAAAARANLTRPSVIPGCVAIDPETNEPVPVTGICAAPITDGFEGPARLGRLGEAALHDLLCAAPHLEPLRTAMVLALPRALGDPAAVAGAPARARRPAPDPEDEPLEEPDEEPEEEPEAEAARSEEQQPDEPPAQAAARLAEEILDGAALALPATAVQCVLDERRGAAVAIQGAITALGERRVDAVVLLAVDALADPPRAERLLEYGRLKSPDHPTGFLPGEAAVALLLERTDSARSRHQAPVALLSAPVMGLEPGAGADAPPAGRVLHDVLASALAGSGSGGTGAVYVDLNGESRRAHEWGNVLVHARRSSRLDLWTQHIPALAFGETGTASPLLAVLLAAHAFARRRDAGDRALVAVVGEDGHRAAFAVRRGAAAGR